MKWDGSSDDWQRASDRIIGRGRLGCRLIFGDVVPCVGSLRVAEAGAQAKPVAAVCFGPFGSDCRAELVSL